MGGGGMKKEPVIVEMKKYERPEKKKAIKKLRLATGLSKKDMIDLFSQAGDD